MSKGRGKSGRRGGEVTPPAETATLTGALLLDKPTGVTSAKAVASVKRLLPRGVKIGHTGTLDPMASGLLVVLLGRATRLSRYVTGLSKSYTATARLGAVSDTLDAEGEISELEGDIPTKEEICAELQRFTGEILQTPPMASAVKVDGERLYKAHRRGETVEREAREATVYAFELTGYDPNEPSASFEISCGGGTYVRTLISDLLEAVGSGAYLTALRRTSVGGLRVEDAVSPDSLSPEELPSRLVAMRGVVSHLPVVEVDDGERGMVGHGKSLPLDERFEAGEESPLRVESGGELLAIYRVEGESARPEAVFCPAQ